VRVQQAKTPLPMRKLRAQATRSAHDRRSDLEAFSKLNGSKFDDAYMRFAVGSHQKETNLFTNETKEGTDQDLKTFASQTLPTLQHHLSMA